MENKVNELEVGVGEISSQVGVQDQVGGNVQGSGVTPHDSEAGLGG